MNKLYIYFLFLIHAMGIGGKSIRTCLSNWHEFVDSESWMVCQHKPEKGTGYLYYFFKKNNDDVCQKTTQKKIPSKNPIPKCSDRNLQDIKDIEQQPLLNTIFTNLGTYKPREPFPECGNKSWKTMFKEDLAEICRVQPKKDLFYYRSDRKSERCQIRIANSDLAEKQFPLCSGHKADPGPCKNNPCRNGGTCLEESNSYRCLCHAGFDPKQNCNKHCPAGTWGAGCKNTCGACAVVPTPNSNGRTGVRLCNPVGGCRKCQDGVSTKPHCKQVKCSKAVCRNNGDCVAGRCICVPGYTGTLCETDLGMLPGIVEECDLDNKAAKRFCHRHGNCTMVKNRKDNYEKVCRCFKGWAGKRCNERCASGTETCLHGVCQTKDICVCKTGYRHSKGGNSCDEKCTAGKWGDGCKEECGKCKLFPCRNTDGKCPQNRCQSRYAPPRCIHVRQQEAGDEQLYPCQLELETDDEGEFYEIVEESPLRKQLAVIKALSDYIEEQVGKSVEKSVDAKVEDITFSPSRWPSAPNINDDVLFARSKTIIRTRQRSETKAKILAEFTVVLPADTIKNTNEFTEKLARNIKTNVRDFKSEAFTLNPESVQITAITLPKESSDGFTAKTTLIYGIIGCFVSVIALVVVVKMSWTKKKDRLKRDNRRSWLSQRHRKNNRPYFSNSVAYNKSSRQQVRLDYHINKSTQSPRASPKL